MATLTDKFCDCGEPAIRFRMGGYVCQFCDWCQQAGMCGGPDDERHQNKFNKVTVAERPRVQRIPEWEELKDEIIALHGKKQFWGQRYSNAERFNRLFREER